MARRNGRVGPAKLPNEILKTEAHLKALLIEHIRAMDESRPGVWAQLIGAAVRAGLTPEMLRREFSFARSTVLRWQTGDTAPGLFTRQAIKAKVLELLESNSDAQSTRPELEIAG
jgi:hypothetical protein